MILSFNIPTYNRASYLKKNIELIIFQIRSFNLQSEVEINVSDNASTDDTEIICKKIIDNNSDIEIRYNRNENNLGPDINYIKTMFMAHGDYSILWGDDDYLKDGALSYIIKIINDFPDICLFISNRTSINSQGDFIREELFFNERLDSTTFDFSNINDGLFYFSQTKTLGGCLSFISSEIYRTEIIKQNRGFDERFNGTFYSFFYYWWGTLVQGNKLRYNKFSYINCTTIGSTNNNFGVHIDRALVDFKGFNTIGKLLFKNTPYYKSFISAPLKDWSVLSLVKIYIRQRKRFIIELLPLLREIGGIRILFK